MKSSTTGSLYTPGYYIGYVLTGCGFGANS